MDLRFYIDPETGEPHIYGHGVSEREVEDVLRSAWDVHRGENDSRLVYGSTESGRHLVVVYAPRRDGKGLFVITSYDLTGRRLTAHRRRKRRRGRKGR